MTYDTSNHLLAVLYHYAPNGVAQMRCLELMQACQRDGADGPELDRSLANALQDGLAHGNWPWTDYAAVTGAEPPPPASPHPETEQHETPR
jgi:hypothetical protein